MENELEVRTAVDKTTVGRARRVKAAYETLKEAMPNIGETAEAGDGLEELAEKVKTAAGGGKTPYQAAVEEGYTGTEAEFYAALVSLKDAPFLPLSGGTVLAPFGVDGPDGERYLTAGEVIEATGSYYDKKVGIKAHVPLMVEKGAEFGQTIRTSTLFPRNNDGNFSIGTSVKPYNSVFAKTIYGKIGVRTPKISPYSTGKYIEFGCNPNSDGSVPEPKESPNPLPVEWGGTGMSRAMTPEDIGAVSREYVDGVVGGIAALLDAINGEVV